MLRAAGYEPEIADSAAHARELLESRAYDVVLADPEYCLNGGQTEIASGKLESACDATGEDIRSYALFPEENPNPVLRISADGTLLYANPASRALLECWGRGLPRKIVTAAAAALKTNVLRELDLSCAGSTFSFVLAPIDDRGYVNLYGRDVTASRRAEEAVRRAERRLRLITDTAPALISYIDDTYHYRLANRTYELWFGLARNQVVGRHVQDVLGAEAWEHVRPRMERALSGEAVSYEEELPYQSGARWVHVDYVPDRDERGRVRGFVVMVHDIGEAKRSEHELRKALDDLSQSNKNLALVNKELAVSNEELAATNGELHAEILARSQAEEALRQSRENLDRAQEVGQIGWWRLDTRRNVLTWSRENYRIFGVPEGTPLTYEVFLGTVHPDDRDYVDEQWKAGLRGEPYDIEHRIVVEGQVKWVREKAYLEFDDSGELLGGFGITQDITVRKQAELELDAERRRLRTVLDTLPVGVFIVDADGCIVEANEMVSTIWGGQTPLPDGITHHGQYKGWWPATGECVKAEDWALARALAKGETCVGEMVDIERFDGTRGTILNSAAPIRDPESRVTGAVVTVQDITLLREAEAKLAEAREQAERRAAELESILSALAEGVSVVDAQGNIVYLNEAGSRMLGLPEGETMAAWTTRLRRENLDGTPMLPEDTATVRALNGETIRDIRYRWITPWKEVVISISASAIRDSEGRIVGATNVFRDATEMTEYEARREELLQRERRIATALQGALIPSVPSSVPCCEVATRYEAALAEAEVGGDFYDVFDLGDDKLGVLIGDVAGKGLPAAVRVAAARHAVRSYAYIDPRPGKVLALANDALCRLSDEASGMVTMCLAVLDTRAGLLVYANGGHETPLLRTADGATIELESTGMALGVRPEAAYAQRSIRLHVGDTLLLYTDGITEARTDPADLFGIDSVRKHVEIEQLTARSLDEVADGILADAKVHGGGRLRDDAAIVLVRWLGGAG